MWIWLIIIAVIIGGAIGFFSSDKDEEGSGCLGGALMGGMGCGYILFQIFIFGIIIMIFLWLFGALFG